MANAPAGPNVAVLTKDMQSEIAALKVRWAARAFGRSICYM